MQKLVWLKNNGVEGVNALLEEGWKVVSVTTASQYVTSSYGRTGSVYAYVVLEKEEAKNEEKTEENR